jgi:hypothetical protein
MVSSAYLNSRKRWDRPQAIIWSNNPGGFDEQGKRFINGIEGEDFIILSDHNRSAVDFSVDRIENRKRMVNGHMRSYHIADKLRVSTSWSFLPSRAFNKDPDFSTAENPTEGKPTASGLSEYTADGGAGGSDLLNWYNNNPGSFYMFISYDKNSKLNDVPYQNLATYSEVIEVYFSSFTYNVVKRGATNHDLWDISISLEEV